MVADPSPASEPGSGAGKPIGEEGTKLFGGVKVMGAVGVAAMVAAIAFYAEAFSKSHEAACRLLPMIGIAAERIGCSSDGQKIENVAKGVERVESGVGRLEASTGVIKEASKATQQRAASIEQKIDAFTKAGDPRAVAQDSIAKAGYSLDNDGYMKAVAQGSEVSEHFKELGIRGDAVALRKALVAAKVDSNEYRNLGHLLASAHSEHYAATIRDEIKSLFASMKEKQSVAPLRTMACGTGGDGRVVDEFVRANLAGACMDETRWIERSIEFARHALLPLQDTDNFMWWSLYARNAVSYTPSAASLRMIPLSELVAKIQRGFERKADEYVRVNSQISLREEAQGAFLDMYDPATGILALPMFIGSKDLGLKQHPCWGKPASYNLNAPASKALCTATVTFHLPPTAMAQVQAVDEVQRIGGGAVSGKTPRQR